jgi:methionine--tRNA ligase beta chain
VARASFARLELRVGRILKCWKHPNADRLWVEDVDVGEPQPRRICSGLAKEPLVPQEQMEGASVVVVANLRAVELRKERSHGMLLAAASDDNKKAALVVPPPEARVGDRVFLHGQSADAQAAAPPAPEIDGRAKDGPWAAVAAGLRTDDQGVVCLYGAPLITRAGPLRSALASSAVR